MINRMKKTGRSNIFLKLNPRRSRSMIVIFYLSCSEYCRFPWARRWEMFSHPFFSVQRQIIIIELRNRLTFHFSFSSWRKKSVCIATKWRKWKIRASIFFFSALSHSTHFPFPCRSNKKSRQITTLKVRSTWTCREENWKMARKGRECKIQATFLGFRKVFPWKVFCSAEIPHNIQIKMWMRMRIQVAKMPYRMGCAGGRSEFFLVINLIKNEFNSESRAQRWR